MAKPRPKKKDEPPQPLMAPHGGMPDRATLPERDAATRREGRMRFVMLLLMATALTACQTAPVYLQHPVTKEIAKTANVRVKRVDSGAEMIRIWGAHERVAVKR